MRMSQVSDEEVLTILLLVPDRFCTFGVFFVNSP